jgi:hypothetical protein
MEAKKKGKSRTKERKREKQRRSEWASEERRAYNKKSREQTHKSRSDAQQR